MKKKCSYIITIKIFLNDMPLHHGVNGNFPFHLVPVFFFSAQRVEAISRHGNKPHHLHSLCWKQ